MLSDILDETYTGDVSYAPIIEMYKSAYKATVEDSQCTAQDIFFADRIAQRIKLFYSNVFVDSWSDRKVTINGRTITVNLKAVMSDLEEFFSKPKPELSVISQGDPTEYNIATKPLLLDYDVGGRIPLLAEVAVINATTAHFGDYLARKYNPGYYQRRGLIELNEPIIQDDSIVRTVTDRRKEFLLDFADMVDGIVAKPVSAEQSHAYACYFVMKLLAVFNISTFDEHETAYLLARVQDVFNKASEGMTVRELTELSIA